LRRYSYPDVYYVTSGGSGYLAINPIEIFTNVGGRRWNRVMVRNLIAFKKLAGMLEVEPRVAYYSGNYSFAIILETKSRNNPTDEEAGKIHLAAECLKYADWPGGMQVHQKPRISDFRGPL
jgi:hypothetical protein